MNPPPDESVAILCTRCQQPMAVPRVYWGQPVACPVCGQHWVVPPPQSPPPQPVVFEPPVPPTPPPLAVPPVDEARCYFSCPRCAAALDSRVSLVGVEMECPVCLLRFAIPAGSSEPPAPVETAPIAPPEPDAPKEDTEAPSPAEKEPYEPAVARLLADAPEKDASRRSPWATRLLDVMPNMMPRTQAASQDASAQVKPAEDESRELPAVKRGEGVSTRFAPVLEAHATPYRMLAVREALEAMKTCADRFAVFDVEPSPEDEVPDDAPVPEMVTFLRPYGDKIRGAWVFVYWRQQLLAYRIQTRETWLLKADGFGLFIDWSPAKGKTPASMAFNLSQPGKPICQVSLTLQGEEAEDARYFVQQHRRWIAKHPVIGMKTTTLRSRRLRPRGQ